MLKRDAEAFLAKVADDEPIFILRAQDRIAPTAVYNWAKVAKQFDCPRAKTDEAMSCHDDMVTWQVRYHDKAKFPD